jgi:uncharacterized membrane protein SpoIIM required for sporulation
MKETRFIDQNHNKWKRFERLYISDDAEPEELSDLYMEITDDLSYSRTFYNRRTVRVYLNQLAQKVVYDVQKQNRISFNYLLRTLTVSLPLEIYRSRHNILLAFASFLGAVILGVLTSQNDPDFIRYILGNNYVDQTLENINNGNPLAIYESGDQLSMFTLITSNNLKVAFLTFISGILLTIGTHVLLFYNGVMLGAFQYLFQYKGLLLVSFLGVWIHGAFEISCIVLAGGAGITIGNGILYPKTYTRLQSLQISTKRGLKIMLSLVPFIIIAGFLESYVTRNYQSLSDWSKWALIIFCLSFILFYFVFYPFFIARRFPHLLNREEPPLNTNNANFEKYKIRSSNQILQDAIILYRILFGRIMKITFYIVIPVALLLLVIHNILHLEKLEQTQHIDWLFHLKLMLGIGNQSIADYIIGFLWTINISIIFLATLWSVSTYKKDFSWKSFWIYCKIYFLKIWLSVILVMTSFYFLKWPALLIGFLILPAIFILPAAITQNIEKSSTFFHALLRSFSNYMQSFFLCLLIALVLFLMVQPIAFVLSMDKNNLPIIPDLLDLLIALIESLTSTLTEHYLIISSVVRQIIYLSIFLLVIPGIVLTATVAYFSCQEKDKAISLREAFKLFGKRNKNKESAVDYV